MSDDIRRKAEDAEDGIDRMAAGAQDAAQAAADTAKDAVDAAAECATRMVRKVQERPFFSLGLAMFIGFVCGACLRR